MSVHIPKPLIGLPADRREIAPHIVHSVGEKYITAVSRAGGGTPLLIPALAAELDSEEVVARLDGLLVTGAYSNIEPHHYGGGEAYPDSLSDPARDATSLALIRTAVARGVPVLGICRGLQELNVAMGGTLHQKVHEQAGHHDHREDNTRPLDLQYAPAHPIVIEPGGVLASIWDAPQAMVNSLHGQGVARLSEQLRVEARAPDGLIEAASLGNANAFCLAVQWHPEYRVWENPFYRAIFAAFGDACRAHAARGLSHDQ